MNERKGMSAAAAFVLSLLFALVFYAFTTPLGPSIGSDNAMYMTIGTALSNGYAPYTEIFDHKGPLLYVLQWIPQWIGGGYSTLAIFVQQTSFLFACLLVIEKIARRFGIPALAAQLAYLALIGSLVGGGNLTEEYANLFTLLGVLLILDTFMDREEIALKGLLLRAGALGACAAVCFLIRANNALVLCALTGGLALALLARRRFAALWRCALGFVLGMLAATVPVALWLAANGALSESIYGSILHNMMYSNQQGDSRIWVLFNTPYGHTALLMAGLSLLGAALLLRRNAAISFAMAAGAAAGLYAAFISHKFYDHYLILGAPLAVVGACVLLRALSQMKKQVFMGAAAVVCAACFAWICVKGVETNRWRMSEREGLDVFTANAQALYAQVPEDERDQFMAYRAEPKWYVAAEALPCMRFFFLQEMLAQADPIVMDEIVAEFENDPPKWLVIYYNREFDPPYDERVAEIFASEYAFVDAKGQYQLLKYKGDE